MEDQSVLIPKIEVADKPVEVSKNTSQVEATSETESLEEKANEITQKNPKAKKMLKKIVFGVLIFLGVLILYNLISGLLLYRNALRLRDDASVLIEAAKLQDLTKIKSNLGQVKTSLNKFARTYKLISWQKFIPYVGGYISDGAHLVKAGQSGLVAGELVVETMEPYADLLGFSLEGETQVLAASTSAETTKDRIDFIVKTIPDLAPKIDDIAKEVVIIQKEISQINSDRYPEKYKSIEIRSQIKNAQDLVNEVSKFLTNGRPFLETIEYILGMDSPRTYLVLFQNDKELRPTGGFMTGYSIMKVDKATFTPVVSDDIYTLDAKYTPSITAPKPIIDYLKGPYALSPKWRLRDMNWSPDFAEAMKIVIPASEKAGVKDIDGVIAVDTQLLVNLLDVMGPIGVSGYGNFSTEIEPKCNCPQVIYELESFADVEGAVIWDPLTGKIISAPANYNNRKAIIGPLMNSIMANALGQPKEKMAPLIAAGFKSLVEKHVLLFVSDSEKQEAVANFGIGGVINQAYEEDYLHVNDANLGGRKSNMYAYEAVDQDIVVASDGTVTKTVTITYQNPEKHDGWLNSVLPTWVRVYVPKGSQLITSEGLEDTVDPYEELGKTVFSGYFELRPEGMSKVTFKYTLPFKVSKEYRMLIQKQPGTGGFLYTINLGKQMEEFMLTTDKEIKLDI